MWEVVGLSLFEVFDVPLVPELAHIDFGSLLGGVSGHVVSDQFPQLFDLEFVDAVFLLFFLQDQQFLLFLKLLLFELEVDCSYLLLP